MKGCNACLCVLREIDSVCMRECGRACVHVHAIVRKGHVHAQLCACVQKWIFVGIQICQYEYVTGGRQVVTDNTCMEKFPGGSSVPLCAGIQTLHCNSLLCSVAIIWQMIEPLLQCTKAWKTWSFN